MTPPGRAAPASLLDSEPRNCHRIWRCRSAEMTNEAAACCPMPAIEISEGSRCVPWDSGAQWIQVLQSMPPHGGSIGPSDSARARVAGTATPPTACRAALAPGTGSKCLPHFINAEPQEIDAKAQDDAHTASSQKGPWIDRPIILVVERSGFGVHAVPPWQRLTIGAQASRAVSTVLARR
jgi:hypothetical protein